MASLTRRTEFDLLREYYGFNFTHEETEDGIKSYVSQKTVLNTMGLKEETVSVVNWRPVTINTFKIIEEQFGLEPGTFKDQYMRLEIPRQENIKRIAEEEKARIEEQARIEKERAEQEELMKKRKDQQFDMMMENMNMMQQILLNNTTNNANNGGEIKDGNTTVASKVSTTKAKPKGRPKK